MGQFYEKILFEDLLPSCRQTRKQENTRELLTNPKTDGQSSGSSIKYEQIQMQIQDVDTKYRRKKSLKKKVFSKI